MGIKETVLGETRKAPINSKNKGNINERAVAKWLSAWTGREFVRTPASGGIRWQNSLGLNICGDVVCTQQNYNFPFTVETKHLKDISFETNKDSVLRENTKVLTIYEQVKRDADRDKKLPIMLLRCNGMPIMTWWVFIDTYIFMRLGKLPNVMGRLYAPDCNPKGLTGIHSNDLIQTNYEYLCNLIH
jgi:Holliday junction resolvase